MFYINKGDHDNPHGLPKDNLEASQDIVHHDYAHIDIPPKMQEEIEKLEYVYQHFQDHKKVYESDPQVTTEPIHDTLYPQMNNNIEYGLFKNVIDSYYLNSQIRDDFKCTKTCYTHDTTASTLYPNHPVHIHIIIFHNNSTPQLTVHSNKHCIPMKQNASLFTTDTATQCVFNIIPSDLDTESPNDAHSHSDNNTGIHFYSKHKYGDTYGDAHIQYHDFDNGDAFIYKDKYTALLQQELQNPCWCLHDPITTQSYQISPDMDIETTPHAMYFNGNASTVTKINHVPYQTIQYNYKGMFPAQLMDDTPIQDFIDNGATPSILPLSTYKKHPILQKYPTTKNTTPIHTGGVQLSHIFG